MPCRCTVDFVTRLFSCPLKGILFWHASLLRTWIFDLRRAVKNLFVIYSPSIICSASSYMFKGGLRENWVQKDVWFVAYNEIIQKCHFLYYIICLWVFLCRLWFHYHAPCLSCGVHAMSAVGGPLSPPRQLSQSNGPPDEHHGVTNAPDGARPSFSQEPPRRQERRFWATLQQQHGSQRKPSLKAKLIKSPITLLCLLTVCCHRGEAPLMRLRSVIYNGGLGNRKLLCCSGVGFTFLNISQTSEA